MKTFIKYPGGKTKELPLIKKYKPTKIKRYFEPFLGSGAVFFDIGVKDSFVNDISHDLCNLFSLVKSNDAKLKKYLENISKVWHKLDNSDINRADCSNIFISFNDYIKNKEVDFNRKNKKFEKIESDGIFVKYEDKIETETTSRKAAFYTCVRDSYNKRKLNDYIRAGLFFFLREYCYSSMFRFSKNGDFNVPYGGKSYNGKHLDEKISYMFSDEMYEYLKNTAICNDDFELFLKSYNLTSGDFIFLDPPYDTEFSTYDKNPFDRGEQKRLRDFLRGTKAKWLLIIKKTDYIEELYKDFNKIEYDTSYMVSFRNRNDRDTVHLLIRNYVEDYE